MAVHERTCSLTVNKPPETGPSIRECPEEEVEHVRRVFVYASRFVND
jgi:hypothetical protein